MIEDRKIIPIILAGGQGSRLYPHSTPELPKQFMPLKDGGTTFLNTLKRVENSNIFGTPIIICAEHNLDVVTYLCGNKDVRIITEPVGRNTAAACHIGARAAQDLTGDSDAPVIILPADHYIPHVDAFEKAISRGADAVHKGYILTFGIRPEFGHTEYGYIEQGEEIGAGVFKVKEFIEKPKAKAAQTYFSEGRYFWNSGMFMVKADTLLTEVEAHHSTLYLYAEEAWANSVVDGQIRYLKSEIFGQIPKISFDYAVMEHTSKACVLEAGFSWRDLGGWDALLEFYVSNTLPR